MQQNSLTAKGAPGGGSGVKSQLVFVGIFVVVVAAAFFLFNLLTHGNFLEWMNVKIIIANMVYPTFMAWGMCFIFACGYSVLSWGGVVVLASFATGIFGNMYGFAAWLVSGIVIGMLLVFINFCIFAFAKIPSWIASLSLAMIYEAIAVFLSVGVKTGPLVAAPLVKELRVLRPLPGSIMFSRGDRHCLLCVKPLDRRLQYPRHRR
jgi:ribose transport system permease protein